MLGDDVPLPLPPPMTARMTMAMVRLVDMPQMRKQTMVLARPVRMTGLRPNLSEAFPQTTAVMLWAMEKTAPVKPAHVATSDSSTPKLAIISGR